MVRKGNLLIVEDEANMLEHLADELGRFADGVYKARNGLEAIQLLENQSIQCVVCDYEMPGLTGIDVIREMRARGITVPVIFYTGNTSRQVMVEAASLGAFGYLNKPDGDALKLITMRGLQAGLKTERKVAIAVM